MSKIIIFIALIVFTTLAFAKTSDVNLSKFNKELNKNMDQVIEHNPQMYETKSIQTRKPASVVERHIENEDAKEEIEQVDLVQGKY
jgi:hypothetical protein